MVCILTALYLEAFAPDRIIKYRNKIIMYLSTGLFTSNTLYVTSKCRNVNSNEQT